MLDCYLSDDAYNNYISLSFKGGAAEAGKRSLRIEFVAQVLQHMDFNVMTAGDFLKARLKAEAARELEAMVDRCVARFESQDYSLGLTKNG